MNIYEKLENYFRNKKLKQNKIEKIPKNFQMELNELDYKKFEDTYPKNYPSLFWMCTIGLSRLWVGGFIIYAIADFLNYNFIKYILLLGQLGMLNLAMPLIVCSFITDIVLMFYTDKKINKHKLYFYSRFKKYKK